MHEFHNEQQAKIANDQCERYKHLMEQFEQMHLPSAHLVPIRRTTTSQSETSIEFRHRLASQVVCGTGIAGNSKYKTTFEISG